MRGETRRGLEPRRSRVRRASREQGDSGHSPLAAKVGPTFWEFIFVSHYVRITFLFFAFCNRRMGLETTFRRRAIQNIGRHHPLQITSEGVLSEYIQDT